MKIKICGITNINDAELSVKLGADVIGFIFYNKSKRYVNPILVKKIINALPSFVIKVGVFVNEESKTVNKIAEALKLNLVQLHGDETSEYLNNIHYPIIKAFRVNENFDFEVLNSYKNCSFLLDSFRHDLFGGTGESFNWNKIPNSLRNKIILAGGISENNIEYVYKEIAPYAIDVSSSIELKPGIKDHDKLNRLFKKYNSLRK